MFDISDAKRRAALSLPLIVAPMFLVSGVELVVASCNAGVIGALPASNARTPEGLSDWLGAIDLRRDGGAGPCAVNLNIAAGRYRDFDGMVAACRDHRVPIIISSVGDPTEIVRQTHAWGGRVLHDVTTLRHARKAIAAGVDGLILVAAGAGGHSGALSPFGFLRATRKFYDGLIVLAGGISDGWGIAAAEALGADLVYMGTRFIASTESNADDAYKTMLIDAEIGDVAYTNSISGLPANFLRQSIAAAGMSLDDLTLETSKAAPNLPVGIRAWKHIWSAGHAVGTIDDILNVSAIVSRMKGERQSSFKASMERLGITASL